jgi:hypothetical protein
LAVVVGRMARRSTGAVVDACTMDDDGVTRRLDSIRTIGLKPHLQTSIFVSFVAPITITTTYLVPHHPRSIDASIGLG